MKLSSPSLSPTSSHLALVDNESAESSSSTLAPAISSSATVSFTTNFQNNNEIKKKRKISNYNVFFRHLHKLLKQVTSHVPFHLEGLYWKKLTDVQRQYFTEDNITSTICQTIMNSFVELWLTTSKNEEIECVEGTIDENEIENNDQEEPTSEIYWCTSLKKFVLYLPCDDNPAEIHKNLLHHPPTANETNTLRKRGRPKKVLDPIDTLSEKSNHNISQHDEDWCHVVVVDCLAEECIERLVTKSSLIGYHYDLIMKFLKDEIIDKDTVSFILGLVYFADWDDYDRESYLWSQTSVIKMIRKPLEWKTWRNQILSHPSYPLINNLFKESRSKYYCFFLCVNLLSLEDEINNFISILQPVIQPSDPHSIPPDSLPLTPPQTILLNLLRDIRNLTPNGLNSTFRRTSCRVGSQYQADIVSISSAPTPTSTTEVSELIYHPNHSLSDLEIGIYLTSAQKIIPIQCGYLLDAVKPTISAAEMDTSLIPPEIHDDESHDSFQSKIVSYNNRLKYLTQTQKLKRGVGMSQTNSGNQLLISKTLDNSFSSSVNLSSNDLSQSSISSVSPQPLNLHSTPALLFKSHDPNPYLVPISDCRQRFCWDDALLEILHHSNYSTQSALLKLHQLASSYDSHGSSNLSVYYNMNRWSKDALHIFFQTLRLPASADACNAMEIRDALKVLQHHKPPELYSMKDILSLYFVLFANDEPPRNIAPQRMLRRNSQQYVPALLSRPVITPHPASYVANNTSLGTPKRWPLSLKYVPYNLYWVKLSNTPCIGLSLDFSSQGSSSLEPSLRVLPFHCETPYKEQLFRCKSLSHFDEIIARQSTEKRTIEFALALKDFAQYELAAYSHCKWYIYPQFVINLISSSAEWKRWRMEVERTLGRNHNRRDAYFSALLADSERFRDQDDRTMTDDYPWNDEDGPQLENKKRKDPSDDGTFTSPTEQPPQKKSISTPQKHKGDSLALLGAPNNSLTSPSNQNHSITRAETPPTSVTKPKRPKCLSNLYWVSKIGLPCIYYGNPGEESNESINLLPISSLTNHYDVRVRYTELTELTSENLIYCHDEKTRDFAQSLISFYEWDRSRLKDNENVIDKPYTWPDLILDLIVHRDKWRPWSKEVEKRLPLMPKLKGKNMRCLAYFEKLKEQYQESLNNNTLESGSEIDESSDTEKYKRSRKKKKILSNSTTTSTSNDITNIDEEKNKIILSLSDHQTTIREKSFKLSNDTTSIHPYTTGNDRTFLDLFPSKLYWLPKLGLPAIFYDDFNKKFENSVCVYPISTITPRYFLECKLSDLQPLNLHNLGTCLEEKTREFANSLILFYDWKILHKIDKESNEQQQQQHEQQRQDDEDDEEEDVVFQWPDFILDIISDFTKWKSFSRQAEKRLLQVGLEKLTKQYGNLVTARIHNYFETLKEFYSLDHQEYPSESIPTSNIITTTTTNLTPDSVAPIPNSPCNPIMIASPSPASVRSTSSDHDSIVEIIPSSSLSPRFLEEDVSDADRWKIK